MSHVTQKKVLRWVSTQSDGGHLVLSSVGKINAISGPWRAFTVRIEYNELSQKYRKTFYFELVILVSKKFYEWKPSLISLLLAHQASKPSLGMTPTLECTNSIALHDLLFIFAITKTKILEPVLVWCISSVFLNLFHNLEDHFQPGINGEQ